MVSRDYEILFPTRTISALQNLRGSNWNDLIANISNLEVNDDKRIAFTLLMARLCNCTSCQIDSYRAIRGCQPCAVQTIERFQDNDQKLLDLYSQAQVDLSQYLDANS
jgi:hypothetical protein